MTDFTSLHRSSTRMGALLAAICAGLVGGSFFIEHVLLVEPCPLCIVQRYTYAVLALVFLGVALAARRPGLQRGLLALALALVLIGGGVAGYQSQLQLFPRAEAAGCSASLSYMLDTLPVGEVIGRLFAAEGDCSDTSFRLLGLTLAQISLGIFAALLLWLVPALRRRHGPAPDPAN
jgi:disulfide bond formation protein DsbB